VILADTTIWINHLRSADPTLERLVLGVEILMHPFVLGELVLGSLAQRARRIREWNDLPSAKVLRHDDLLAFVEAHRMFSRGIGYTDANLLASAATSDGVLIWTRDTSLSRLADEFGILARLDH
jgi:predicted nucleic acid-binding protein